MSFFSEQQHKRMGKYTLNLAPLKLEGNTKVLVGRQAYDSDRLHELRAEFRGMLIPGEAAHQNEMMSPVVTE
jgi:hypothetical protein